VRPYPHLTEDSFSISSSRPLPRHLSDEDLFVRLRALRCRIAQQYAVSEHRVHLADDRSDVWATSFRFATAAILYLGLSHVAFAQRAGRTDARLREPPVAVAQPWPNDSSWRQIGPAAFGGRVDDIEAVASDPRIIFVASAGGGVFRSKNNGTTWEPVFDKFGNTLSIGDIAIAPSDPNVVWVGTGEANNRQSSTLGDGVYKSTDGGTTWRHMGLRETQSIGRIVIDPRNSNVVVVAAVGHLFGPNDERGLYRTKDGGATWQKVLGVDANTGATDVVMSPDGRTLVAAMYQRRRREFGFAGSGPGSGLWRSTDGGDTWSRVTSGMPAGDLGRIGLDISASNPNTMYAIVEASPPGGGVYRSDDGGATWVRKNSVNQRGNYFSQIRVDPTNPNHLWLLATALLASNDGGATFSGDSIAPYAHPDHHAMWIDPKQPQHVMLGNDGGVYFSYDNGRSWSYIDNLPISQFYDISIDDREPYWIYGGAQDNGSWAFPSATYSRGGMTNLDVQNTGFGDGFQSAVDPIDHRFIHANSQNGRAFLADMVTREERFIQPVAPAGLDPYRFNWNTAMQQSPNDPRALYIGAQKLLRSTDRGTTWREISPDLTKHVGRAALSVGDGFPAGRSLSANDGVSAYGNITTISESPSARGTIYVGTDDGNVQMTTDGGNHWTDLTPRFSMPQARYVSKVYASRHDARTAFVAFDGHWDDDQKPYFFKTSDGGVTWTSIANDLPNWKPVKTVEEDPRNPNLLFVGTEFGLYWTLDGGRHWSPATGNVPPVMIDRIIVNPKNNDLILATHGRGVIILDDIAPLEESAAHDEVRLLPARAAAEVQTYRDLPWPGGNAFVAKNSPIGTYFTYVVANDPPTADSVTIQVLTRDGSVVNQMVGPDRPGTNRVVWDMRYQFKYVPPASDSGFYGPPRAPYVPSGEYTVALTARGRTTTEKVQVRNDSRGASTPAGLNERIRVNERARDISRTYFDVVTTLDTIDVILTEAKDLLPSDSAAKSLSTKITALRQRARGNSITSGIGRVFDLTAAIESSSMPPTEAQQRSVTASVVEFTEIAAKVNDIISNQLPALSAKAGRTDAHAIARVRPPE
jgi:photosystem II stability/assembly factor-like uncharacterized protein